MIAIANLEKYFQDHPEFTNRKIAVLEAARNVSEDGNILVGGAAMEILGDLSGAFFDEIENDPEHQEIGIAAIRAFEVKTRRPTPDVVHDTLRNFFFGTEDTQSHKSFRRKVEGTDVETVCTLLQTHGFALQQYAPSRTSGMSRICGVRIEEITSVSIKNTELLIHGITSDSGIIHLVIHHDFTWDISAYEKLSMSKS
ncbi:MAG: hypothetical protein WC289_00065 [Patescibacteria group bacterium]|jgi:hypothetical protein